MLRILLAIVSIVFTAAPAMAQSAGVSIPEPTDGALFALGLVGLIVGRQVAKRRK